MNFYADIACLIGHAVAKNFRQRKFISKAMRALRHQSYGGPEVCGGIISDKIFEGDFDEWFKQESHKLLGPQRMVSSDVLGLHTKAMGYFAGFCRHHWDEA